MKRQRPTWSWRDVPDGYWNEPKPGVVVQLNSIYACERWFREGMPISHMTANEPGPLDGLVVGTIKTGHV